MVGSYQKYTSQLIHQVQQFFQARVALFAGGNCSGEIARVTNHIWIRIIHANNVVFARYHRFLPSGCNFSRFHQRLFVELAVIRRNLDKRFQRFVKISGSVSVPKEGNVSKFLRFRARESSQTVLSKIFTRRSLD